MNGVEDFRLPTRLSLKDKSERLRLSQKITSTLETSVQSENWKPV